MAYNRAHLKVAQMMPPAPPVDPMGGAGAPVPPMDGGDMGGMPPVEPAADQQQGGAGGPPFSLSFLIAFIDQDPATNMEMLKSKVSNAQISTPNGDSEVWSLLEPDKWAYADDGQKGMVAGKIMEMLPPDMKVENDMPNEEGTVQTAPIKNVNIAAAVRESDKALRAFALSLATPTKVASGKYNRAMQKVAEGLAVETYPLITEDTVVDHRTHQPLTPRDIVERNKSYGLRPDDVFSVNGIDFDAFWQKHIMDRYYEGYIEDRFEVDRNVPDMNNMHLKPGQRTKPELATLLEGRLDEKREKKTYNYAASKAAKAVKVACADQACTLCGLGNTTPKFAQCDDCRKFTGSAELAGDQKKK